MKIFKILLLIFLTAGISLGNESHDFKGKVIDGSTGEPMVGVSIFIPELNKGTMTDINGSFILSDLPDKKITIQFSYLGYSSEIRQVNPKEHVAGIIIEMKESALLVDEVVVSAAHVMSKESSPIVIEKIGRDDLLKTPAPSLMSTLTRVPGVNEISLGPGISKPVIRGLSFSRVLSLYQGARFENQQWGADHGLGMNETGIASVELIKGPASIIYGSGAMAGVVNLIEEADASAGEISGDVNIRGYSNSLGWRGEAGIRGTTSGGLTWTIRGAMENHADYLDGHGNAVGNTRFNTENLKVGIGYQKAWGNTKIRYTYLRQGLGILDETAPESLITTRNDRSLQLPFQNVSDHFINSETTILLGKDRLKATFGYHINYREEVESTPEGIDLGLEQRNFMYDMKYFKNLTQSFEAIIGVQGFYLTNDNYSEANEILVPNASKADNSIYTLLNFNKNAWVVQGGIRYDLRKVVADASDPLFVDYGFILPGAPDNRILERTFQGVTASGGATFRPSQTWRFRLNIASGFRAPDLAELFSNGPHPGTNRFEAGNANFLREQNIQTDFGLRFRQNNFSLSGEIFYNHVDNYIFFSPTTEMMGDLIIWNYEQDDARLYGGEIGLDIHPKTLRWLSGSTSLSTVIGERRSDGSYLPYIPPFRWNQEVSFKGKNRGPFQNPYFSISGSYIFDQNREAPLEEATEGYYLLGMNAGSSFSVAGNKLDLYLSGSNLLNLAYLNHLSLYRAFGILQTGRNIVINARWTF